MCTVPIATAGSLDAFGAKGLYQPKWTAEIQDEWQRNLLHDRSDLTPEQVKRTDQLMNEAIPDAMVTGYENLIASIELPDLDDRHVVAAAVRCNAEVIVTANLKDFPGNASQNLMLKLFIRMSLFQICLT
jgi:hypothetical protein